MYPKVKPPEGCKRVNPPNAPNWPPTFQDENGDLIVALRHPTPSSIEWGTGIGCSAMALVPLVVGLIVSAFNKTAGGQTLCCLFLLLVPIAGFGLIPIAQYIGSLLNGMTTVRFNDKKITVHQGKKWKLTCTRDPKIELSFRYFPLHDAEERALGKSPKRRLEILNRRQILLVFGYDKKAVTTMLDKNDAEAFTAVLNAARDSSVRPFKKPTRPHTSSGSTQPVVNPWDLPQ